MDMSKMSGVDLITAGLEQNRVDREQQLARSAEGAAPETPADLSGMSGNALIALGLAQSTPGRSTSAQ